MNPFPFSDANRELRLAWADDLDAALGEAESLLGLSTIPLDQRVALKVDIGQVRAALVIERKILNGETP
ncbi:MAG: hypothetical protein JWO15_1745 [Sphingomonadales bacterium]|nr:hypothetical protein [Sphingomonadales bacterium]